jgi:hypothetical protein
VARRIQRARDGTVRLSLPRTERALLRSVHAELSGLLDDAPDDPDLRRLFPPAYVDDADGDAEYRRLVGDQLADGRRRAFDTVAATLDRDRLTAEEADSWLRALNDARLVLGTRLDVTEEMDFAQFERDDPRAPEAAVYLYLSWLVEQLVEAVA